MKTPTAALDFAGVETSPVYRHILYYILLLSVLLFFTYNYYTSIRVFSIRITYMCVYCARDRSIVLALYIYICIKYKINNIYNIRYIHLYCTSDSPTAPIYIIIIIIIILVSNCLHEGQALRVWATTKVSERVNDGRVEVNIYNTSAESRVYGLQQ